jgi:hypothetical protein
MSQPVKLSDTLILDARVVSAGAKRSIAGQIEFWAGLGRAVEVLLRSPELAALQRVGDAVPVSSALARPGTTAGDARVAEVLAARPFPHYEPAKDAPGLLVCIEEGGKRTTGRFVQRKFVAVKPRSGKRGTGRASRRP